MDNSLVPSPQYASMEDMMVLILVVMDNSLVRVLLSGISYGVWDVLILVVMDNSLVHTHREILEDLLNVS